MYLNKGIMKPTINFCWRKIKIGFILMINFTTARFPNGNSLIIQQPKNIQ